MLLPVVALIALAWYAIPAISTNDALWPLPPDTRADAITVYRGGQRVDVRSGDPRYARLMSSVNGALGKLDGIEYRYGLPPADIEALRASGRALEARYRDPARSHGLYAVGTFTRLLIVLEGPEYDRRLIFLGDQAGYRAGPLRARDLTEVRAAADGMSP